MREASLRGRNPILNDGQGFPFFGTFFDAVTMSTNGLLHFHPSTNSDARANECPLGQPDPNGLIAVLWDDLFLPGFAEESGGFVYEDDSGHCIYGAGGSGACVVFQWTNADHVGGGTDSFDFQAVLYDSGNILLLYPESTPAPGVNFNPEHGSGSTTGIQNAGGSDGLLHACDTNSSLPPNFAVLFIYPAPEPPENMVALAAAASVALAARRGRQIPRRGSVHRVAMLHVAEHAQLLALFLGELCRLVAFSMMRRHASPSHAVAAPVPPTSVAPRRAGGPRSGP